MHAITQSAIWIKAPMADAGVVIVTSAALPPYMIDKLHVAIADWDQVAYLVVKQPRALMLDWLQTGPTPMEALATPCHASQLLRSVSRGGFLLDAEVCPIPRLSWLGSVCGHSLHVVKLEKTTASNAAMDNQVEAILSVARILVKIVLRERCVI